MSRRRGLVELDRQLNQPEVEVVSTDIFDTVLLRDGSSETERLAESAERAANRLGVDPWTLTRLRWSAQVAAYRAVAIDDPTGDASLTAICDAVARAAGLPPAWAEVIRECEIAVELAHLRPDRRVVDALLAAAATHRVIAVSDTYHRAADVARLLRTVAGVDMVRKIYTSCDVGATKHSGALFHRVAADEGLSASAFLHVGDNLAVDCCSGRTAGWRVVHLPRGRAHRTEKLVGHVRSTASHWRRWR